jgi:hypothetical protein
LDPPSKGLQPISAGTPEPPGSLPWKIIRTPELFQPLPFGLGINVAVTSGIVLSILTFTVSVSVFPATSVQLPAAGWLGPSVVIVMGAVQNAIPELASVPVNVTVTFVLFQPLPFALGDLVPVVLGAAASRLTRTDEFVVPPVLVAEHETVEPAAEVFVLKLVGQPVVLTADCASTMFQLIVMVPRHHPALPGILQLKEGEIVGAELSTTMRFPSSLPVMDGLLITLTDPLLISIP